MRRRHHPRHRYAAAALEGIDPALGLGGEGERPSRVGAAQLLREVVVAVDEQGE